jgi:hypothetical protein
MSSRNFFCDLIYWVSSTTNHFHVFHLWNAAIRHAVIERFPILQVLFLRLYFFAPESDASGLKPLLWMMIMTSLIRHQKNKTPNFKFHVISLKPIFTLPHLWLHSTQKYLIYHSHWVHRSTWYIIPTEYTEVPDISFPLSTQKYLIYLHSMIYLIYIKNQRDVTWQYVY